MVAATGTGGEWVWVPLGDTDIPNTWQKKVYKFNGRFIQKWAVWVDPDGKKYVKEDKVRERLQEIKELGRNENMHQSISVDHSQVPILGQEFEKNTTCEICSLDFITAEEFASHQKLHESIEDESDRIKTEQESVLKIKSESSSVFQCDLCNKKYTSKWNLKKHKEKHHSDQQNIATSLNVTEELVDINLGGRSELVMNEDSNQGTVSEMNDIITDLSVGKNPQIEVTATVSRNEVFMSPFKHEELKLKEEGANFAEKYTFPKEDAFLNTPDLVDTNVSSSLLDPMNSVIDMEVGVVHSKESNKDTDFRFSDDEEDLEKPHGSFSSLKEQSEEPEDNKCKEGAAEIGVFNIDTMSILDRYKHILLNDVSSEKPTVLKKYAGSGKSQTIHKDTSSENVEVIKKDASSETFNVIKKDASSENVNVIKKDASSETFTVIQKDTNSEIFEKINVIKGDASSETSNVINKDSSSQNINVIKNACSDKIDRSSSKNDENVMKIKEEKSADKTEIKASKHKFAEGQTEEPLEKVRKCMLCDETFTKKKRLIKHLMKHKENAIPKSKLKDETSKVGTIEEFQHNMKQKKSENEDSSKVNYSVETSEQKLLKPSQMKENKADKAFNCISCDKTFKSERSLKVHKGAIHDGIKHPCENCDYKATTTTSLKMHQQSKHGGIKFPCNSCDYKASNTMSLSNHKRGKHSS